MAFKGQMHRRNNYNYQYVEKAIHFMLFRTAELTGVGGGGGEDTEISKYE